MAMFLQDLMTGTGIELNSRNADTGGAWTRTIGSNSDSILNSGYFNASGTPTIFKSAATPAGTDYETHAFTTYKGNTSGFDMTGPAVCVDGSGNCYAAAWRLDANGVCLYRYDAGARTLLTSVARTAPSVDTAVKISIKRVWTGSTNKLTVSIDDVAVITDHTDATITATNSPGLIGRNAIISNGVLGSLPTGFPIDKIEAWDVSGSSDTLAPSVPGSLTLGTRTASTLPFTWAASTDSGGGSVSGYKIQVLDNADTVLSTVDVGNVLTYTITGLAGNTLRKLRVAAYDNAVPANQSAYSSSVSGTTLSKTATVTVKDVNGSAQASETSLRWAACTGTIGSALAVVAQGTAETTDGSGDCVLDLNSTALSAGNSITVILADDSPSARLGVLEAVTVTES
jgi:hypothetical protein